MPELPEVEVTRLSFADRIAGARIVYVRMGKPLRWPLHIAPESLVGRKVIAVRRRGKYLLLDLDDGLLLIHLGMSGSLSFAICPSSAGKHDHFDLETTQGVLRLNDPRRFGAAVYAQDESDPVAQKLLGRLGMEPLGADFDPQLFYQGLMRRKAPIKQVLLAGDVVVGVGNIYASEVLFLGGHPAHVGGIALVPTTGSPFAPGDSRGLGARGPTRGSTLRDFTNAHGEEGLFQLESKVYGRAGQPCKVCATPVRTIRQGQRSTFFCPQCQKP